MIETIETELAELQDIMAQPEFYVTVLGTTPPQCTK